MIQIQRSWIILMEKPQMRIAILGTRGIPANYGGFETFAEKLSIGLLRRGHDVTVYCRPRYCQCPDHVYQGVKLAVLPTIPHKYLDTVANTALSVVHSLFQKYDALLICNSVNSLFSFLPRVVGKKVIVNVDGLEWQRAKWNRVGKAVYRMSEILATVLPDAIVTDSITIRNYYMKRFKKESTYIPYGVPEKSAAGRGILDKLGLKPRDYVLYVSRLEPENNALAVVRAFERTKTTRKLVMVGDAPYNSEYIRQLRETIDRRILFTGYVFGNGYGELQSNAYLYVQATEVGGTHPALLEGMGYGNCILANDVPEHREVLGDSGVYFSVGNPDDLISVLQFHLDHPEKVEEYRRRARQRAREKYSWESVIQDYERLFRQVSKKS
jgi:glycosyltransferase involved in cell wall biosynthesis